MRSLFSLGLVVAVLLPGAARVSYAASTETELFKFNGSNGRGPTGALIADASGNLYGTTARGGVSDAGTVFRLTPPAAGKTAWSETVLFSFNRTNGYEPYAALTADKFGNLYGTTYGGGPTTICVNSCGTVFELTPPSPGKTEWTQNVLVSFNRINGALPYAGLVLDHSGKIYGTTERGGAGTGCGTLGCGTVFELLPPSPGHLTWTEHVLVSFRGPPDGAFPDGTLHLDGSGNLYGTTKLGGASTACNSASCGTVFKLTPSPGTHKQWSKKLLKSFARTNGGYPIAGLIGDKSGNLFGTTEQGGAIGGGAVFELMPPAAGKTAWTERLVFSFNGTNGSGVYGGVVEDLSGNLFGTTINGGASGAGNVFKLAPPAAGSTRWAESTVFVFNAINGDNPQSSLIVDNLDNLYGVTPDTSSVGAPGGIAFKLTPQ